MLRSGMTQLVPNTVDASRRSMFHVTREDGKIKVAVGSRSSHGSEHYIMWIAIVSGDRLEFRYLNPRKSQSLCLTELKQELPMNTAICTGFGRDF